MDNIEPIYVIKNMKPVCAKIVSVSSKGYECVGYDTGTELGFPYRFKNVYDSYESCVMAINPKLKEKQVVYTRREWYNSYTGDYENRVVRCVLGEYNFALNTCILIPLEDIRNDRVNDDIVRLKTSRMYVFYTVEECSYYYSNVYSVDRDAFVSSQSKEKLLTEMFDVFKGSVSVSNIGKYAYAIRELFGVDLKLDLEDEVF